MKSKIVKRIFEAFSEDHPIENTGVIDVLESVEVKMKGTPKNAGVSGDVDENKGQQKLGGESPEMLLKTGKLSRFSGDVIENARDDGFHRGLKAVEATLPPTAASHHQKRALPASDFHLRAFASANNHILMLDISRIGKTCLTYVTPI